VAPLNCPPQFGVALQGDKTPAEYVALAQVIDELGFEVVSVYNDLGFQPALGPLLWMAPHLRRARRVGPAALNPYLVHPVEIAGQAALLDLATGGRAYLGLARGAWLDGLGVAQARPVATLREAALLVMHLLAGRVEPFEGELFRARSESRLQYRRIHGSVPITIGTWGIATARMAGEVADEIKIGGSANPALVARLRGALAQGASAAGRSPDAIGVCLGAVTVVDEDRALARALARREVARYLTVVGKLDPSTDPDWLARIAGADSEAIAADIPDAILDRFAFAGTADDVIRQIESILDAGATRVEFGTPLGPDPYAAVRLLGRRVLPAFGRR
jgi:5,10-methylenetetrahydromethanopterin reductase